MGVILGIGTLVHVFRRPLLRLARAAGHLLMKHLIRKYLPGLILWGVALLRRLVQWFKNRRNKAAQTFPKHKVLQVEDQSEGKQAATRLIGKVIYLPSWRKRNNSQKAA